MRIATWNVNGLRARFDFVLHWLRDRRPDIVALQELKLADEGFPTAALAAEGYQAVYHGQRAWNGVAVLSRLPIREGDRGLPDQQEMGARMVTTEVTVANGSLLFTSVYCPNGKQLDHPDFAAKLAWLESLAEHLRTRHDPAVPHVVAGDFNVCPGPLDSWNESLLQGGIFHTPEERGRFADLLDWGLVDLYRHAHPQGRDLSWWDYRGGAFHRRQGLRIDFLLATRSLVEAVRSVEIDREYRKKKEGMIASDHAPVIADLAD